MILTGNALVKVEDNPDLTVYRIKTDYHFTIYKENADTYIDDAKRILDKLSEEFNGIGIEELVGAMIYVMFVENYYGKHNKRKRA